MKRIFILMATLAASCGGLQKNKTESKNVTPEAPASDAAEDASLADHSKPFSSALFGNLTDHKSVYPTKVEIKDDAASVSVSQIVGQPSEVFTGSIKIKNSACSDQYDFSGWNKSKDRSLKFKATLIPKAMAKDVVCTQGIPQFNTAAEISDEVGIAKKTLLLVGNLEYDQTVVLDPPKQPIACDQAVACTAEYKPTKCTAIYANGVACLGTKCPSPPATVFEASGSNSCRARADIIKQACEHGIAAAEIEPSIKCDL